LKLSWVFVALAIVAGVCHWHQFFLVVFSNWALTLRFGFFSNRPLINKAVQKLAEDVGTTLKWAATMVVRQSGIQTGIDSGILYRDGELLRFHGLRSDFAIPNGSTQLKLRDEGSENVLVQTSDNGVPLEIEVIFGITGVEPYVNGMTSRNFINAWRESAISDSKPILPPLDMQRHPFYPTFFWVTRNAFWLWYPLIVLLVWLGLRANHHLIADAVNLFCQVALFIPVPIAAAMYFMSIEKRRFLHQLRGVS
jgi:hypothetical protein